MSTAKSIFYVASAILIIFLGSFSLATWNDKSIAELKQQVVAAYEWVMCKVRGGVPKLTSMTGNIYYVECKKI